MNTPKYEISKSVLIKNYIRIKTLLSTCTIHYAMKANASEGVIRILSEEGCSFESASKNEFIRAVNSGASPEKILFGLPIKTDSIISELYTMGCRNFVFDDIREYEKIKKYAPDSNKILRLNICDIDSTTLHYGMELDEILKYENSINLLSKIDGISFHISNNFNLEIFNKTIDRVEELLELANATNGRNLILDIGGGYVNSSDDNYFICINERLKCLKERYQLEIKAEPGNFLVNECIKYYTKVVLQKYKGNVIDVFIDGGVPNGAFREPQCIKVINKELSNKKYIYRFFDMTCAYRLLFIKRLNYMIEENDILEFSPYGAYTYVYQNKFHLWDEVDITTRD